MATPSDNKIYDIAIIGGGIAGAGLAREAALRGATVVLFEKNTFGSGTSSKSSRLIHGGIRYLELSWSALGRRDFDEAWKNFRFVFSSLRECRVLEKIAPDLVRPLPLIIPIYSNDHRGRASIFLGALFYSFLSCLAGNVKPVHIYWTKQSILKKLPALNPEGLRGGIRIWDHATDDHALVQKTIASAVKHGARCFENAEVLGDGYTFNEDCHEMLVRIQGQDQKFQARKILNASGPWVDQVRDIFGEDQDKEPWIVPIAGSHITVKSFIPYSAILQAQDGRIFFAINQKDTCRVGTTEWRCDSPDHVPVPQEDKEYLLQSLAKYFPGKKWSAEDILSSDAGIRPLASPKNSQNPNLISREHEIRLGPTGIIHVLGVKLTDHRRAAEEIIGELVPELRRHQPNIKIKSISATTPLSL